MAKAGKTKEEEEKQQETKEEERTRQEKGLATGIRRNREESRED